MKNLIELENKRSGPGASIGDSKKNLRVEGPPFAVEPVPLASEPVEKPGQELAPRSRGVSAAWRGVEAVWRAAIGIAEGGRLVRLVGPNERPEERHEFEQPKRYEWRHY